MSKKEVGPQEEDEEVEDFTETKKVSEQKYSIEFMRPRCVEMFALAPNTFEAVCIEHNLNDDKQMTKERFMRYHERYASRPVIN